MRIPIDTYKSFSFFSFDLAFVNWKKKFVKKIGSALLSWVKLKWIRNVICEVTSWLTSDKWWQCGLFILYKTLSLNKTWGPHKYIIYLIMHCLWRDLLIADPYDIESRCWFRSGYTVVVSLKYHILCNHFFDDKLNLCTGKLICQL